MSFLRRFECLGRFEDLANAVLNLERAVKLSGDSHSLKACYLSNLGSSQETLFKVLGKSSDLTDSISNLQQAVDLTNDENAARSPYLFKLGNSLRTRFDRFDEQPDYMASVASFREAAKSKMAYPHDAVSGARSWAEMAHRKGDFSSALEGYRMAIEMLPMVAWLGLDTPSRQDWLHQAQSEVLGCQVATCAIQLSCFDKAVELLDLQCFS